MTDLQTSIAIWRQKAIDGTLTQDEMRQAIIALREGRVGAAVTSARSRAKKAVTAVVHDADDLLSELGGLT